VRLRRAAMACVLSVSWLPPAAPASPPGQAQAEGAPCREEDDPLPAFEYKAVAVTIDKSCWKRQVNGQCTELVKGWSTKWVAAEARKAIDRVAEDECIGSGIQAEAKKRMDRLTVRCEVESAFCGRSVLNSRTLTLSAIVADKGRCAGATMTHEMLHSHAGLTHAKLCAQDTVYSCDQSCFRRNTCQECSGASCSPNWDAVHAELCKAN
jgi:hypothetical protein